MRAKRLILAMVIATVASPATSTSTWAAPAVKPAPAAQPTAPRYAPAATQRRTAPAQTTPPPTTVAPPVPPTTVAPASQTVDLSTLDSQPSTSSRARDSGATVNFKAYADMLLINRPGVTDLTFGNVHSFVFLDLAARSDFRLSFDVNSTRGGFNFLQFDWQASPTLLLSMGKIWIPFDELDPRDPHYLFGGRVGVNDVSFRQPGQTEFFLPDLWTELGVSMKYQPIDTAAFKLTTFLYLVNGFQAGTADPRSQGSPYPTFNGYAITARDNNRDKAFGGRVHTLLGNRLGLGVSFYSGRWNNQAEVEAKRTLILGADARLRLSIAEVRAGGVQMTTGLGNSSSFTRGGFYGELGVGSRDGVWKFLVREGSISLDNRVEADTDMTNIGGKILYRPSFVQWSLEHSRDVLDRPTKAGKTLTFIRAMVEI